MKIFKIIAALSILPMTISAQSGGLNPNQISGQTVEGPDKLNTITTAVPFLNIGPDSRAGAMADVGVSSSPDANSIHWNPSKLAFVKKDMAFSISYTPWLQELVSDIDLAYVSFFKKLNDRSTFGASLRYFSLGTIQFTDDFGNNTVQVNPNEFALDAAYALKLSDHFSSGIALRFVNSNLTAGQAVAGVPTTPGRSVAADVSGFYQSSEFDLLGNPSKINAGINISNIGNKMAYSTRNQVDFIPMNLKLGPSLTMELDDYNKITIMVDANRLLVPTPPRRNADGDVVAGEENSDKGIAAGIFSSFSDAPGTLLVDEQTGDYVDSDGDGLADVADGSVFREEMRENNIGTGIEYWYDNQFAVRTGYFWEHALKGNRKFMTLGAGFRYNVFGLDLSYLIPVYFGNGPVQNAPLANTLRFTLSFDFDSFQSQNSDS